MMWKTIHKISGPNRVTGVQTFMVSHSRIVYEKDLGPDTLKVFKSMERFNPDKTWQPIND